MTPANNRDDETIDLRKSSPGDGAAEIEDLADKEPIVPGAGGTSSTDQVMTKFGKYTIIGELGRGGMAVVYRARDEALSRNVALKLLPMQYSADPEFVERFQREAQAAAALEHPGIISVYDLGQEGGTHYIVMELVEGESLEYLRHDEGMDFDRVLDLCAQVADGLACAHSHGIVHRDIKPSNIMVDKTGRARIADFGLARPQGAARLTLTGDVLGSPSFMSPEQARGGQMDHRTDIYSLGTVLYDLLCGRPPFQTETTVELLKMVSTRIPQRPRKLNPDITVKLEAIILKAMEHDPKDRYQNAGRLAADLKSHLLGEPVSVRPPRFFERIDRFAKRHKVAITFVATLSMAVTLSHQFITRYIAKITHRGVVSVAEHVGTSRRLTGEKTIDLFSFADNLLAQEKHREALLEYERIMQTRNDPETAAYSRIRMGDCRLAMGNPEKAAGLYALAYETAGPGLPELRCMALYARHTMEAEAGNVSQARVHALAMHTESNTAPGVPPPAILLRNLAMGLRRDEKYDDALVTYRDAARTTANAWRAERISLEIARTLAEKGDLKKAAAVMTSLRTNASSPDVRGSAGADLILLAMLQNKWDDAVQSAAAPNVADIPEYAALIASLASGTPFDEKLQARLTKLPEDHRNDAVLAIALVTARSDTKQKASDLLKQCVDSGKGVEWPARLAARKLKELKR